MWFVLLITLVTLTFAWIKWKYTYWSRRGVPNPEPAFFFGNVWPILTFKEHVGKVSLRWYNEFKNVPYVGYYKLLTPAILLRDPDLIKDVLIKDASSFHANDFAVDPKYDPLMATNPFIATGETWKRGRNILVPIFSATKIKSIYPEMESACKKFIAYLKSQPAGKDLEGKSICAKYTTENVIKCSFSMDAGCFEPGMNEFRHIGRKIFQPSFLAAIKFVIVPVIPKWLGNLIPVPMVPAEVDSWFRNIVTSNKNSRKSTDNMKEDFVQMLLNAGEKYGISETELAGHTMSLFIEGFETSSNVLSFTLHELARNPEWQERLHDEIIDVLEKHDNKFTYDALQDMTLLDCVIQEAMRLHPILLQMQRICTQEYTLPKFGDQKEGVKVYPGTTVVIPVLSLQMDPNFFPDPDVFNPERFNDEERKTRHKAHFLPFGEGPRMCMGMRFGLAQVKAGVMSVVQNFKITLSPNHKPLVPDPRSFMQQPIDGILFNFELR